MLVCVKKSRIPVSSPRGTTNGRRMISAACLMVSQRETNLAARRLLGASVKAKMLANTSAANLHCTGSKLNVHPLSPICCIPIMVIQVRTSCFPNFQISQASTQDFDPFLAFKLISGLSPNKPTPRNTGTAAQDAHLGCSDQLENFSAISINCLDAARSLVIGPCDILVTLQMNHGPHELWNLQNKMLLIITLTAP